MVNYSKPLPFLFAATHSNKPLNKNYVVVVVVVFFFYKVADFLRLNIQSVE